MKMTSFRNMNTLTFLYFIRKSCSDNILYDICVFYKNDIFLYTPVLYGDWYRAYSKNGSAYLGYVYRKRILPYDKCPINIKKKMKKIMFD